MYVLSEPNFLLDINNIRQQTKSENSNQSFMHTTPSQGHCAIRMRLSLKSARNSAWPTPAQRTEKNRTQRRPGHILIPAKNLFMNRHHGLAIIFALIVFNLLVLWRGRWCWDRYRNRFSINAYMPGSNYMLTLDFNLEGVEVSP